MFKLAQRGGQRGLDVFGVGAGAEMHQQFTHIAIAFTHAHVDFFQHGLDFCRRAAINRLAHELHLDFQKGQRLRNRVVQLARDQVALL